MKRQYLADIPPRRKSTQRFYDDNGNFAPRQIQRVNFTEEEAALRVKERTFHKIPPKYLSQKIHEAPEYIYGEMIDWVCERGMFHTGIVEDFDNNTGYYTVRSVLDRDGTEVIDGEIKNKSYQMHYSDVAEWLSFPAAPNDDAKF